MLEGLQRQVQFPIPMSIEALHAQFCELLPAAEIPGQEECRGVRSPFAENPSVCGAVQSIKLVAQGKCFQGNPPVFSQALLQGGGFVPSAIEVAKVWLQP